MFYYGLLRMDTPVLANQQKHIHQYCVDTGCSLEDLLGASTTWQWITEQGHNLEQKPVLST